MKFHDEELMVMFAAGMIEAFDMLYERYRDRIYRFALVCLHHPQDAEEIVQEVFMRLSRSGRHYHPQGKFKAWLFQIAANRIRSLAASRSRDMVRRIEFEQLQVVEGTEQTSDQVLDRDLVRKALASLPEQHRLVLVLRELEGFGYDTIARSLGLSPENARVMHHRARRQACTILNSRNGG